MGSYEEVKDNFIKKLDKRQGLNLDKNKILQAIKFGEDKHSNQKRKNSKDPYFIHCLRVSTNLINELDSDVNLIIAALLHDTVEDTKTSIEELEEKFGSTVRILVEGMTKVPSKYKDIWGSQKYYEEGFFGRLKQAAKRDNRVWKIKLSDRSDNMIDYHIFQSKKKIKNYIWEGEQFIKFASNAGIISPLIERLQEQINEYHKIINQ